MAHANIQKTHNIVRPGHVMQIYCCEFIRFFVVERISSTDNLNISSVRRVFSVFTMHPSWCGVLFHRCAEGDEASRANRKINAYIDGRWMDACINNIEVGLKGNRRIWLNGALWEFILSINYDKKRSWYIFTRNHIYPILFTCGISETG